jgi:signal transduction histidine kinase
MLLGYSRDELVGPRVDLLISSIGRPRSSRAAQDRVWFVPAETGAYARHRSGRQMPVEVTMCPHDRGSSIAIVRALGDDRLGLREIDVAQIVHDLKNPLATMALETCLLDEKLARGDNGGARSAVARITRNIEFVDRMVEDLLDSCSIDAGQFEIHRQPTELRAIIERVVERTVAGRDRDRVAVEAPHPIVLAIDDLRIERVVANLLGNALKYAPRGPITVRLERVESSARLSVSDSGPGMTPPEMAYVFDKYRRAAAAHGLTGNGLGLYVSKKIVETHGGRIGVDSVGGGGSRFFFELPTS